jgi:hypothetical protein
MEYSQVPGVPAHVIALGVPRREKGKERERRRWLGGQGFDWL